jgi:hypothetical protein
LPAARLLDPDLEGVPEPIERYRSREVRYLG